VGSGPPYLSTPLPGCPLPGDIAQLFSSMTKQFASLGITAHATGSAAAEILPPPIWNFCQSISVNLSPSEVALIASTPDEEIGDPGSSPELAGSLMNLSRIPASCSTSINLTAKSRGSGLSTYAKFVDWNCPALISATNLGQSNC
jgi:hypothetical protein